MGIEKDSYVTIDYLIRLGEQEFYPPDGKPEEISFCMGWGAMPPGLEEALLGLEEGAQKEVHLPAADAYGETDQELIMEAPKTDFAPDAVLEPGQVFETEDEEGQEVYFLVREVRDEIVVIDFNHPLAGRDLDVSFTVRQVREATPEELDQQSCCTCGEEHHRH